jgi:hypothetical protein
METGHFKREDGVCAIELKRATCGPSTGRTLARMGGIVRGVARQEDMLFVGSVKGEMVALP